MSEITAAQVGANIKYIRKQANCNQAELAKLADLHATQIAHYERGHRMPTVQNLIKIAEALRCSIQHLIYGKTYDSGLDLRGLDQGVQCLLRQLVRRLSKIRTQKEFQDSFVNSIDQWNYENR